MTHIIIDGNVSKIKSILEGAPLLDDSVSYMCDGISYGDIQDIYNLLLREKRYSELKDYNECKFLIENAAGQMEKRKYYPLCMQIEHTSYCNARCIMCYHYYMQNQGAHHIQEHVFEKIREWLPFVRLVGLHGFGEPFLAKNLDFYLSEYHKYGVELYTNTNLSFIPDEVEDYYDDFKFINISCDGATKEVFEGIRQNIRFEDFIRNVKQLRMNAPDTELIFAVVLMRQNLHQCEDMVRLAAELGINKVTFSKVGINYVIGNYEDSVDLYPATLHTCLQRAAALGKKLGVDVVVPCSLQELHLPVDCTCLEKEQATLRDMSFWKYNADEIVARMKGDNNSNVQLQNPLSKKCFELTDRRIRGVCDWLTDNIYISATGRVGFCCSNFKYYIGDLIKESLDDIWNSNHYLKMIQAFQSGRLPHFCRNCNILEKRMLKRVEEIGN